MNQDKQQRGISLTVGILSVVISCILGIFFAQLNIGASSSVIPAYEYVGTVLKTPRPISKFQLTGTDGKSFNNESLKGHWTMVFFGFTNCAMMCPTAMRELSITYQLLQSDKVKPLPQILMVSVDPKRDSLKRMREYVTGFNKSFIGAIGPDEKVRKLSYEMGIAYEKVINKNNKTKNYDIQHSGAIIVLDPKGEIKAFFNWPHKPSEMAQDYTNLIS